jgi:pSer/pThr/pTyr-binding forkhead associated (FHA) protein
MPILTFTYLSGPDDGRSEIIDVSASGMAVTIGRHAGCGISIPGDPDASRQHARLEFRDGRWWLEDLGSANGTFVGEFARSCRISEAVHLLPGQIFRVGLTRLRLEEERPLANSGMKMDQLVGVR